jgi:hypothetical protein
VLKEVPERRHESGPVAGIESGEGGRHERRYGSSS